MGKVRYFHASFNTFFNYPFWHLIHGIDSQLLIRLLYIHFMYFPAAQCFDIANKPFQGSLYLMAGWRLCISIWICIYELRMSLFCLLTAETLCLIHWWRNDYVEETMGWFAAATTICLKADVLDFWISLQRAHM